MSYPLSLNLSIGPFQHCGLQHVVVTTMPRRESVDLSTDEYKSILECLPITGKRKEGLVSYTDLNFKHAPKWGPATPYYATIEHIIGKTHGLNVNQQSFYKAAIQANADLKWGYTPPFQSALPPNLLYLVLAAHRIAMIVCHCFYKKRYTCLLSKCLHHNTNIFCLSIMLNSANKTIHDRANC